MAYDSAIVSFTTKTNKVDLVDAAHINTVQSEIVTIETRLGVSVSGNRSSLAVRLGNALDADGSIFSGSSYPSPALASQMFYRTDLDLLYVRNAANSTWNQVGQSLSATLFQVEADVDNISVERGPVNNSSLVFTTADNKYMYRMVKSTTYITIASTKWTKIAGVSTITVYAQNWADGNTSYVQCSVGGQTGSNSTTNTAPTWLTFTIDVSGLVNGTTYDVLWQLKSGSVSNYSYLGNAIAFGS